MTQTTSTQATANASVQEADLWPEPITVSAFEPKELPVDILEAQAKYLAPRTEYLLKGLVRSSNLQSGVIYHNFYVYAPYVRDEPFKAFYIKHGVDTTGDITLVWGDMGPDLTNTVFGVANGLEDLRSKLKDLLADPPMLHLIGNLLAMSKKAKANEAANPAVQENSETQDSS